MASPGNNNDPSKSSDRGFFRSAKSTDSIPENIHDPDAPSHKSPRLFIHRPVDQQLEQEVRRDNSTIDLIRMSNWENDVTNFAMKPCRREALLPGIAGGSIVGALRFVAGASVGTACNWSIGTFLFGTWGFYEMCQFRRRTEKENIRKAIAVLDERQAMKKQESEEKGAVGMSKAEQVASSSGGGSKSLWSSLKFW